ncbi:hypothetical protein ADIARSV_0506 [Arcticibacter svalbardensis MN12-7]|uniref:Lipoprotein n=1 Tax=Arcticibacter svalbardensis MN12-7 TaxID=1150600 RepID=R9GWZ0_9SPHI|nr:hypothetical protein [Arcticibacter svalbardensis]EOR96271.1 hypothetical protein ADIARSV_0506 [Arcticibacter svalbardensis MN12-7]
MKKLLIPLICLLIAGCSSKELTREQALELIRLELKYPKVLDYDLYAGDPKYGRNVLDAGLEKEGYVKVNRTVKLGEMGTKPIVEFTHKAEPYFLPTSAKDKKIQIQKVKIADVELTAVTGLKMVNDNKNAVAEYTTTYKNLTPFSILINKKLEPVNTHKAYLSLYEDGWRIEKNPGMEFLGK